MPNRLKNYVLWMAVAGLIGMGLMDLGLIQDTIKYDKYVEGILYILALTGIVNNPSLGNGLKDK